MTKDELVVLLRAKLAQDMDLPYQVRRMLTDAVEYLASDEVTEEEAKALVVHLGREPTTKPIVPPSMLDS